MIAITLQKYFKKSSLIRSVKKQLLNKFDEFIVTAFEERKPPRGKASGKATAPAKTKYPGKTIPPATKNPNENSIKPPGRTQPPAFKKEIAKEPESAKKNESSDSESSSEDFDTKYNRWKQFS